MTFLLQSCATQDGTRTSENEHIKNKFDNYRKKDDLEKDGDVRGLKILSYRRTSITRTVRLLRIMAIGEFLVFNNWQFEIAIQTCNMKVSKCCNEMLRAKDQSSRLHCFIKHTVKERHGVCKPRSVK